VSETRAGRALQDDECPRQSAAPDPSGILKSPQASFRSGRRGEKPTFSRRWTLIATESARQRWRPPTCWCGFIAIFSSGGGVATAPAPNRGNERGAGARGLSRRHALGGTS